MEIDKILSVTLIILAIPVTISSGFVLLAKAFKGWRFFMEKLILKM
ncbi:MAG: hypothetical protein ACLU8S_03210 [Coprococcus phoceensis]